MNRREYLTAIGATALYPNLARSTASSEELSSADFLVPSTEIPDAFTRGSTPANVPLFERLRSADASFADADLAHAGFWAGGTEENPEWVLVTAACVVRDEVPFESVIKLTDEAHHNFIAGYDEETPHFWRFEGQHEAHPRYLDWCTDIWIKEWLLEGPQRKGERHMFTETMRLHSRGPVALWGILFGRVDQSIQEWSYDQLLTHITKFQQDKLDAISDKGDVTITGDFA